MSNPVSNEMAPVGETTLRERMDRLARGVENAADLSAQGSLANKR